MKRYNHLLSGLFATLLIASLLLAGFALSSVQAAPVAQEDVTPTPAPTDNTLPPGANPFPDTPWAEEMVREIVVAVQSGQDLQTDELPVITPLEESAPQLAAVSYQAFLPFVRRSSGSTTPPPTTTPNEGEDEEADVAASIWPNPSVYVVRNGTLAVELRVRNHGDGDAESVDVRLPYNRSLMQVYGSNIPSNRDWVIENAQGQITVRFGRLSPDEHRTATLFFRVASNLADGALLPLQATYGSADDNDYKTNTAPVTVGRQEVRSAWSKFNVAPAVARVGSSHLFVSDRFLPGEGISYWLNMPDGSVRAVNLASTADSNGYTSVNYITTGLPPGNYSLVGYGRRSDVTVLGFFAVTL